VKHNIIYHNRDLDGFCSGAIAKDFLLSCKIPYADINMIGYHYGDPMPELEYGSTTYMLDVSFTPEQMLDLSAHVRLVWYDHHKSAIEDSVTHGYNNIPGVRRVGDSASLIAFQSMFVGCKIPEIVYWVDRYDVWKKSDPLKPWISWNDVMHAQYGMRSNFADPRCDDAFDYWRLAFNEDFMQSILEEGRTLFEFEENQNAIRCKRAFDLEFQGLKFACINAFPAGSSVLNAYASSYHDALMVFSFNGATKMWEVSMYKNELNSESYDLSEIAKEYGGGGHASACGFSVKDIIAVIGYATHPA